MVDAYFLLDAMDGIYEEQLMQTKDFLGISDYAPQKRRSPQKLWTTVLIAAILALLLAACGYAVYRATMSHRELHPEDENGYYLNIQEGPDAGRHLELNQGTCALAVHFDTEAEGCVYGFLLDPTLTERDDWELWHLSLGERLKAFSDERYYPPDQVRGYELALREASLTREEAETWDYRLSVHGKADEHRLILMIEVADAPELHGTDLIFGWPKGTAEILRDESWGEYQLLEFIVDREWDDGQHEYVKHLLLFHPEEQYLLKLSAPDDAFSFEELESLAEGITVTKTDLRYSLGEKPMNWSVCDLGEG